MTVSVAEGSPSSPEGLFLIQLHHDSLTQTSRWRCDRSGVSSRGRPAVRVSSMVEQTREQVSLARKTSDEKGVLWVTKEAKTPITASNKRMQKNGCLKNIRRADTHTHKHTLHSETCCHYFACKTITWEETADMKFEEKKTHRG